MAKGIRTRINPFAMSFLDTVSAGFGAAFFLFIIFASLPIEKGSGMMGSQEFIDIKIDWYDKDVVMELLVTPPNSSQPIRFYHDGTAKTINPITGQYVGSPNNEHWYQILVFGTSDYGVEEQTGHFVSGMSNITSGEVKQSVWVKILGPCQGEWQFAIAQKHHLNIWQAYTPQAFLVTASAYTSKHSLNNEPLKAQTTMGLRAGNQPIQRRADIIWQKDLSAVVTDGVINIEYEENDIPPYCLL